MRPITFSLAFGLVALALGPLHALHEPWTLSNFEYAKEADVESSGKNYYWTPSSIDFRFSDSAQMCGTPPNGNQIIIQSILFSVRDRGNVKVPPYLEIREKETGKTLMRTVTAGRTQGPDKTIYYSKDESYTRPTWQFTFNDGVALDASTVYSLVFTDNAGNVLESADWANRALSGSTIANDMFEGNVLTPFILISGTYTPPPVVCLSQRPCPSSPWGCPSPSSAAADPLGSAARPRWISRRSNPSKPPSHKKGPRRFPRRGPPFIIQAYPLTASHRTPASASAQSYTLPDV